MSKSTPSKENNQTSFIVGESTPVRIGLIIAFLTFFAGAIWWASSITSKLDSILSFQATATSAITELKATDSSIIKEISDMKLKYAINEVTLKNIQDRMTVSSTLQNPIK